MQTRVLLLVAHQTAAAVGVTEALSDSAFAVLIARTPSDATQVLQRVRPDVLLIQVPTARGRRNVAAWGALAADALQVGARGYLLATDADRAADGAGLPDWPVIRVAPDYGDLAHQLDPVPTRTPMLTAADVLRT